MEGKAMTAALLLALCGAMSVSAQFPIKHVAVLMVDGLHQIDVDNYIAEFPYSSIAQLAATGVKYTNDFLPPPSDSFPAVATFVTGASAASHGIIYESPYSRGLYPAGSKCQGAPGTPIDYSESDTSPPTQLVGAAVDPSVFPLNATLGCTPVYPNNFILDNTIFGVATKAGLKTAWSDKALNYRFVAGPGDPLNLADRITDTYFPAIDFVIDKKDIPSQIEYDELHLNAVLNWIEGNYANGTSAGGPFNLFGSTFQALNAAQKSAHTTVNGLPTANPVDTYTIGGYGDASAIPNDPTKVNATFPATNTQVAASINAASSPQAWFLAEMHTALAALDSTVGQTVNALKAKGIYESTALILCSKHGNSPINHTTLVRVPPAGLIAAINTVTPVASSNADTGAYVWLKNNTASNIQAAAAVLLTPRNKQLFNTQQVLTGAALAAYLGTNPDRVPDLFVVPVPGTVYTGSLAKVSDHGGLNDDDLHLGLIISNPLLKPGVVTDKVSQTQLGVTALSLLGVDYTQLTGVAAEGTKPLPGLSFLTTLPVPPVVVPPVTVAPITIPSKSDVLGQVEKDVAAAVQSVG